MEGRQDALILTFTLPTTKDYLIAASASGHPHA